MVSIFIDVCIHFFISEVVNGGWGPWSSFSRCSKTCGGGLRTRTRRCDKPVPSTNGVNCPGSASHLQKCNIKTCRKFHSLFKSQHMQWVILTINLVHCIWKSHFYMDIACGVDRYPRNMPCRNSYSCPKLVARKGCNKKFTQVLPAWCWQKLSNWDRRQLVKNYCKRSCKNCLGRWMCHI